MDDVHGAPAAPLHDLAQQLSDLARDLEHESDVEGTLVAIVHAAVGTVPGAQHVSISAIKRRRQVHTLAATSDLSTAIDVAQYETGQGPCLDALYQQLTVRLPDMAAEQRWPEFSRRARELGAGSMLAVQLYVQADELGALNLLNEQPHAFEDEDAERVALLFATHAALAMAGAQAQEQLRHGLDTRDIIGQAKGILMERHKITGDLAFRLLSRASQDHNRKLHDIAGDLVRSGELPR